MVAVMTVSCKNNNKKAAKTAEANAEVVEAAKTILADDVLATLDELAQSYINESGKFSPAPFISSSLSEEDKLIKPDYLLEPSLVNEMVTKSQKVTALAVLALERHIRLAYGMPTESTDEALAHLTAELNHPVPADNPDNLTPSEKIRRTYLQCKEDGELSYFWQFALALQIESGYLISNNIDAFFRNLNEEQYASFLKRIIALSDAAKTLAEYESEVKQVWDVFNAEGGVIADISKETIEDGKKFFSERKDVFATRRAALLK